MSEKEDLDNKTAVIGVINDSLQDNNNSYNRQPNSAQNINVGGSSDKRHSYSQSF